ncbi:unnamed protein product [Cuscuta campestris]|uniref:Replication protein A 70 kDa DNA-binding subunit B/D first OB fold domain-containing protein n=1 Tax=Cuscuta campestris TaxID=132261 RepID=A0A484KAP2_9ASTE|nr:unnamed protein product [Cuscuta campestris]
MGVMITALKNVHEKSGLLMMKLGAIRVYHVAAHSRGPESLDVVFHDSEGARIHAKVKDTDISTFKQDLQENAVYLIMRVKVLRNFQGTKTTNHPCMLQFLGKTKIQKLTDNGFPNFRFYFKNFEDVLKTKFADQVFLVDIIGKVVSRTVPETRMVKNAPDQMMEITLENHNIVSTQSRSRDDKRTSNLKVVSIHELKNMSNKGYYWILGDVVEIENTNELCYLGCPKCNRKVAPDATRFKCLGEGQSTMRPPLFDGTNYTYWKERMRIFIQSNNFLLWRIIKNGEEVPMKKVGETTVPKTEAEYDAQDIKKIENNAKAINILYCAVNPDDYRKISCCSTAKEMWDKLEITYEGTNQVREAKIDFLTHEYELFRMKENEKIDEMFERFSKIVNDLHALKKTYTDKELVRKILRSLTPEWRSKADAIQESIGISSVTIDGLRGNLKTYESTILYPSLGEQKKNGIALKASTSQERDVEDSSDKDEFGMESTQKKPYYFFYYDEKKKIHIPLPEPTQIKPRYRHSVRVDWNPPTAKRQVGQGGQRKRSRTGKNVASSLAPPPPAHKYLDGSFLWFNDHAEATRFSEKFEHREILPPRFSTAHFIHESIPREARVILERGNFLDLLHIKKVIYHRFLVRAFYSNLKKDEDGALISNVNGVDIYLNEENIQILTGLRRDGQDLGLYVGE